MGKLLYFNEQSKKLQRFYSHLDGRIRGVGSSIKLFSEQKESGKNEILDKSEKKKQCGNCSNCHCAEFLNSRAEKQGVVSPDGAATSSIETNRK